MLPTFRSLLSARATMHALSLALLGSTTLFVHGDESKAANPPPKVVETRLVGAQKEGGMLVTTNQLVTPLGKVQSIVGERP